MTFSLNLPLEFCEREYVAEDREGSECLIYYLCERADSVVGRPWIAQTAVYPLSPEGDVNHADPACGLGGEWLK